MILRSASTQLAGIADCVFEVGFELFGYLAGEDRGFYFRVSFCKEQQHGFIHVVID